MREKPYYLELLQEVEDVHEAARASRGLPAIIIDSLAVWQNAPDESTFPIEVLVAYLYDCGKHFLPAAVLDALADARITLDKISRSENNENLRYYLSIVLDKYDDRYDYNSYTANQWIRLNEQENMDSLLQQRDATVTALLADIIRFERSSIQLGAWQLPSEVPDKQILTKREHLAYRALSGPCNRLIGTVPDIETGDKVPQQLFSLCAESPSAQALLLTIVPVYIIHDEYMFIRILQCFEVTFQLMAVYIEKATQHAEADELEESSSVIECAHAVLVESACLFSLLATLQPMSFATFRRFTEGASAIQSDNYKRFEAACGKPRSERLNSPAFESVPNVRDDLLMSRTPSLQDVARPATTERLMSDDNASVHLRRALLSLEEAHQRWKTTHLTLARRMIGDQTGTGYTAGTPYLASVLENRLFWRLHRPPDRGH
ncbi:tryptophan 2,3-dioxygenase family protein [Sciscionella marina]|uniref:tryptophan 2,3-dioxygenase family protein n=1 Tax=Sciscionella marina TaxID=508770 RepID=UPI00146DC3CF|nr:tryptophan 2,3-dioxygenase family protein [Sciscionella marina]